jgi:redox-sensing transcriptional repressor
MIQHVKNITEKQTLPSPTLERLAHLYTLLGRLEEAEVRRVSSRTLGELLSVPGHTVRKDLSILCGGGVSCFSGGRGYDTAALRALVGGRLGLGAGFPVCLAGLGRLGSAILHKGEEDGRYPLAAAFDASVNRIELERTKVPLYHSSQMSRVVREKNITVGIIAVPPRAAREVAERLVAGGVRGIVNFTPVIIPEASLSGAKHPIVVRNACLTGELDVIAAYLNHMRK